MTSGAWLHRMQLPPPTLLSRDARERDPRTSETRLINLELEVRSISTAS